MQFLRHGVPVGVSPDLILSTGEHFRIASEVGMTPGKMFQFALDVPCERNPLFLWGVANAAWTSSGTSRRCKSWDMPPPCAEWVQSAPIVVGAERLTLRSSYSPDETTSIGRIRNSAHPVFVLVTIVP